MLDIYKDEEDVYIVNKDLNVTSETVVDVSKVIDETSNNNYIVLTIDDITYYITK